MFYVGNFIPTIIQNKRQVVQGGCTDGTYYYVLLNDNKWNDPESISKIFKYKLDTGEKVAESDELLVGHGNDMTINTKTGKLIVVQNAPEGNKISIFNPDNMELEETKTLALEICSMAYDSSRNCYWVGLVELSGYNFARLDSDFQQVGSAYEGVNTGFTTQGIDVDSKYIYFCQYNTNCIVVYDKQGNYVKQITLSNQENEAEHIFHVGGTFYIGYHYIGENGGALFRMQFD